MSRFSDKSDFADTCLMHYSPDKIFYDAKISIGIGTRCIPIKVDSPKDLIPYYGNLISAMGSSDDRMTIILTSYSRPDEIDEERLMSAIDEIVWEIRRSKRKKEEVNITNFSVEWSFGSFKDSYMLLVKRAIENQDMLAKLWTPRAWTYDKIKDKAIKYQINKTIIDTYFSDFHTAIANRYREELLRYAAPYFGEAYKAKTVEEYNNKLGENHIYNPVLIDTLRKVDEYYKILKEAKK